jgi:hypothetical protein
MNTYYKVNLWHTSCAQDREHVAANSLVEAFWLDRETEESGSVRDRLRATGCSLFLITDDAIAYDDEECATAIGTTPEKAIMAACMIAYPSIRSACWDKFVDELVEPTS